MDRRPDRINTAPFSNSSGVVWIQVLMGPKSIQVPLLNKVMLARKENCSQNVRRLSEFEGLTEKLYFIVEFSTRQLKYYTL